MNETKTLKGITLLNSKNEWYVRYEFGKGQVKNFPVHPSSIKIVEEYGCEGEEIDFVIRGTEAPRTLNGFVQSALIIIKD
jgi:hypothetical protein